MIIRQYDFNVSTQTDDAPVATGGFHIPTGTTAQRPTGAAGLIRHNITTQQFEGHNGTDWGDIGGGSGAGSRNYLSAWFDGAKSVGTVTNSITATGNITPASTWKASDTSKLTVANVTSGGLRDSKSLKLDHIAVGAGFVQTPEFALDLMDLGKPVTVSFDYQGVTTADDYQVYMVRYNSSGTYQEQILVAGGTASATTPYSSQLASGAGTYNKFQGYFIPSSTSTDLYALRFVRNSASDTTDIMIDSLYVGPQNVVQGAAITDWKDATGIASFTNSSGGALDFTNSEKRIFYYQSGQNIFLSGTITASSSGTGTLSSDSIVVSFSGIEIDTALLPSTSYGGTKNYTGNATWNDAGVYKSLSMGHNTGPSKIGFISPDVGRSLREGDIASGDIISFNAGPLPIVGWSSNVTMANRAVEEYASNTDTATTSDIGTTHLTNAVNGSIMGFSSTPAGTSFKRLVRFNSPILPTDKLVIEIAGTDYKWIEPGCIVGTSTLQIDELRYDGTNWVGIGLDTTNASASTDVFVVFGKYRCAATAAWSASSSAVYYRVRKVSGGAVVGYPISARNIVGDNSGTTVPSGYIGEKLNSSGSGTAWTSGQYMDGGNAGLTLTPGVWLIKSIHTYTVSSDSAITTFIYGVGTASGTSATGLTNQTVLRPASHTPTGNQTFISTYLYANISTSTTYYPKFYLLGTRSGGTVSSDLEAIRIA